MTTPEGLNVAVLGAGGTIAPGIVRDLAQSDEVERMLLLDLEHERAAAVASVHGGGKALARASDARNAHALPTQLDGVDVLVNTASYRVNLDAMRACLVAGCNYLDLGGLYWMTRRQLALAEEFEDAEQLALVGIGSSPGKTNVMAQRALGELEDGDTPESIDVFAGGRDLAAPDDDRLRPPYALQTLIDELTLAPVVIRDSVAVEIEPMSDGGTVDYGPPIGEGETIYTLHSELATFAESFGCRAASFRLSLAPALLARLRELVGSSEEELHRAAREAASPSARTVSVQIVRVRSLAGRLVTVRAVTEPHFGLGGSVVSTAAPAAAAVRLLARGSLDSIGVLPPEGCIEPEEMFAELERRGCRFSVACEG